MGVLRLSLGVRILHGPKNDQSLCNIVIGVLSSKDRVDGIYFVLSWRYCITKNVNTIPSSCMYKLSQSYNYEIGDCFYDEGILHKIMPLGFNGTSTNIWTTITIPSCINNISNHFCLMQHAHTLYMDLSNLVSIQIKFKLFTSRYLYIHSSPILAIPNICKVLCTKDLASSN
jgi:hypothetical protein